MSKRKLENAINAELMLAILSQLYSIELLLADVFNGKANLRYSNEMLERDKNILDTLADIVGDNIKKEFKHEDKSKV